MRLVIKLSLLLMLCAAFAGATTIVYACSGSPASFQNGAGATTVSCPGYAGVDPLNSVTLSYAADYQFGNPGFNDVSVTFTPDTWSTVTWSPISTSLQVTGNQSSGAIPTGTAGASGFTAADFLNAFSVDVTSAVAQGAVLTSSGAVWVTYDFGTSDVPEPASMALLGGGLVAAFLLGRRRRRV